MPNLAYSDPEMAEIALRNIERRAKHKVTRPEIKVGLGAGASHAHTRLRKLLFPSYATQKRISKT